MKSIACIALCSISLLAAAYPRSEGETATSADGFVDRAGVNIHLHYTDTSYGNFAKVASSIKALGVRHVRDGLIDTKWTEYYDRLNQLGHAGVKATLITSPKQSDALLSDYPRRVRDGFEAYEAPNEYDQSGDADWPGTLNSFLPRLYKAVKENPATAKFPVVGPSLTHADSYPKVAVDPRFFDFANLHNYWAGRNPGTPGWGADGYGSFRWTLRLPARAWPGKPVMTTETGYFNDPQKQDSVPEEIAGKYLTRLLFEQALHGIERTYIYELADLGGKHGSGDGTFGLVHADFSPKPGFTAVKNVLQLLSDPGPSFRAAKLEFALSGDLNGVDHMLLEKRNGTFYLAIWIEEPGYDVNAKKVLPVASRNVELKTDGSLKVRLHQLNESGEMRSSDLGAGTTHRVEASDQVAILEVSK